MGKESKTSKSFGLIFILLSVVNLITAFGFSMISTIISPYAMAIGASLSIAGIMAGIFSISALFIRPISGFVIDIFNKWNMCIVSVVLICIAFLGYTLAPNVAFMLFVRILHGFAFGINGTVCMVLVSDCVPKERLGEGLGYFGIGQIIAQICGPNLGIIIKGRFSYQFLFGLIAILTLAAIALLLFAKSKCNSNPIYKNSKNVLASSNVESNDALNSDNATNSNSTLNNNNTLANNNILDNKANFSNRNLLKEKVTKRLKLDNLIAKECMVYALIAGLFSLGNGITNSFLVLLGEERTIRNIGWFFTINAIVLLLLRLLIGKVIDRMNLVIIVNLSLIVTGISMFMIAGSTGITLILLSAILKAIGQGGGQLSLQSACLRKVDALRIGIASSTYYIGADIGQGFGPIIGGKLSEAYSYKIMFYAITLLMVLGLFVFNLYERHKFKVRKSDMRREQYAKF